MASGEYQAYVQREAEAGRRPITVGGWLARKRRAEKKRIDDIIKEIAK